MSIKECLKNLQAPKVAAPRGSTEACSLLVIRYPLCVIRLKDNKKQSERNNRGR